MDISPSLVDTATLSRTRRVAGVSGGWDEVATVVATGVKCRVSPLRSNEILVHAQRGVEVSHAVQFEPDQTLEPRMVAAVAARDNVPARTIDLILGPIVPSVPVYAKMIGRERTAAVASA